MTHTQWGGEREGATRLASVSSSVSLIPTISAGIFVYARRMRRSVTTFLSRGTMYILVHVCID